MKTYKLKFPVKFEDEVIEELKLDVEGLAYKDLRRAEREAQAMCGKKESLSLIKAFDDKYTSCLAAIAAKVKSELIFALKATDFTQINILMRNFLLNGEWEEEATEEPEATE